MIYTGYLQPWDSLGYNVTVVSLLFNANGEYIKTKERLIYSRVNSKYKPIDSKSTCEND